MTAITATKEDKKLRIIACDHAGTSDTCVAISALMYALEGALLNNEHTHKHVSRLVPGYAEIEALAGDDTVEEDFRFTLIGLMQLQKAHPEDIEIYQNFFD